MNATAVYKLGTSGMTKEAFIPQLLGAGSKLLPKAWKALRYGFGGRRAIRTPLLWGGLPGGAIGYLAAPEGQKLRGTLSGAMAGTAGMAGWRGGERLIRGGMVKGLGTAERVGRIARLSKRPWFTKKRLLGGTPKPGTPLIQDVLKNPTEVAKALGSKALLTGAPFLGAWELAGIPYESGMFDVAPSRAAGVAHSGYQRLPRGFGATPTSGYPYGRSPYGY